MALSPNEGLKRDSIFLVLARVRVGMALSPNEGLKRNEKIVLLGFAVGRNGAKPE